MKRLIERTRGELSSAADPQPVIVGFDGFVDEIVHVVDEREDPSRFQRMATMEVLADRVRDAAGLSCNIELVTALVKLGGNGPIMADALANLGHPVTYVGAVGKDGVHPVFEPFAAACRRVVSIADPAHTDALEFRDGKVLLGKMGSLRDVNWENLTRHLPEEELADLVGAHPLAACVNWTMIPFMNSMFRRLTALLARIERPPLIYVDLTDPRKRKRGDLVEALGLLRAMQEKTKVVLGLNENESAQVAEAVGLGGRDGVVERAVQIRSRLGLHAVVIHPLDEACAATAEGAWRVAGPYTPEPRLTTGAGDVFNAGFCHGLLHGLSPESSLISGVSCSGFYVRARRAAAPGELDALLQQWAERGPDGIEAPA
jgi:sugar/nucleoside kinase (ribokinase family)